jgi:AcrR family transcriptional regulator
VFMSTRKPKTGARKTARPAGNRASDRDVASVGREKVSEIQRGRILAAMTEVASERGAANVSVAHVVARSGVSRRTFYELFEDREACFLAAFDDTARQIAERVVPAYERETRWRERIRAALAELLDFLDEEPRAGRLCIVESLAAGPQALERRARVLEIVKRALQEGEAQAKGGRKTPPLTAEGAIGAVSSVLHARLAQPPAAGAGGAARKRSGSFAELLGPLMAMIILPYQGPAAAMREVVRPRPPRPQRPAGYGRDPLRDLDMRLTYRTVRVLLAISATPGASNRALAAAAGVADQGQISKLLSRLRSLSLIENIGAGPVKGEPNAWQLTSKGERVERAIQQTMA